MSPLQVRRWTRQEYDRMAEAGVLAPGKRAETLRRMSTVGSTTRSCSRRSASDSGTSRSADESRPGEAGLPETRQVVGPPAATTEEAMMTDGLEALYTKGDADAAAAVLRKVLEQNPTHYGATFQLATALDRAEKPAEARPLWEKVAQMAEGYKD